MPLPDVTFALKDGALGILPESTDKVQLTMGCAAAGPVNALVSVSSREQLVGTFAGGPLVEACALKLEIGGGPLLAIRLAAATPGALSSVNAPAGAPAVGVNGAPQDFQDVRVRIVTGGALAAARFVYSLDGGESFSPEIAASATYPLADTGLTLTFAEGTYVRGHTYGFVAVPPHFNVASVNDGFDAALLDAREWGLVHLVGAAGAGTDAERASACAAVAAAVSTKMRAAELNYRFARAVVEAPNVADDALRLAFADFVDPRVAVVAGFGPTLSPLDGTAKLRSIAWTVLGKLLRKPIGKDPAQVHPEEGTGPLPVALRRLARDERKTPGLDAARFVTARTHIGRRGFYVTNFPLMSGVGSDYRYLQHGQVIDAACKAARFVLLGFLSRDLDLNDDGTLDEGQAQAIDDALEDALRATLVAPGHASDVVARVNRTDDVLATETLRGSFGVQPKFYPKHIHFDVGFVKSMPAREGA